MAKQKGILKVQGSVGGLTFYQRNGKDFLKVTSGPSKEKIKNDPSFKRTRENNQEFAGSAMTGKALRMGLVQEFKDMSDSTCVSRIVKVCREVISKANGVRGQRPFLPADHKDSFLFLSFNQSVSFDSLFLAPYTLDTAGTRNQLTIQVPDFNTGNLVHAPAGATHFRLVNLISALSSYQFNTTTSKYEAADTLNNAKNDFNATDYIPLGGMVGAGTSLTSALAGAPILPPATVLIACIGIEFYQEIGGAKYLLSSGNAMKIVNVY
jgi:hypothetical protein